MCLLDVDTLNYDELSRLCHRIYIEGDKKFNFYGRCGIYIIHDKTKNISGMCDRAKLAKKYIVDDYAKPYAIYDQSMRDGFVTKKEFTSELLRALQEHEFKGYYQPIYEAKTEKLAFAEALVRWEHPTQGLLLPGKFIPAFEENGYISELDFFVASHSSEFIKNRIINNKFAVPVAGNLSRMDFYNLKLTDMLISNIKNACFPAGFARIEITESAYSSLMEHNGEWLNTIKDFGIEIILDDFGSGYSSFSSIRNFDFEIVKLDKGFIQQIGITRKLEIIIKHIIDMAHDIGIKVIAEGVETKQQFDFLVKTDCDYIQGFYYSRPLPEKDFEKLLDNYNQTN